MKKLLIAFLLTSSLCFGMTGDSPFDPGAARSDLNNVTPATGRAALELGTMAVATATDYVATDTFTGHTDATGASVHGLGTISTKADTDYVATSSLAARVDTINASFTGDIDVTGDVGAATVNGVAPLTAAEKTQALVGSTTVDFLAKAIHLGDTPYGTSIYNVDIGATMAIGSSATVTLTKSGTTSKPLALIIKYLKSDDYAKPSLMTKTFTGALASNQAVTVVGSSTEQVGISTSNAPPLIEWINGADGSQLVIRITNTSAVNEYPRGLTIEVIGSKEFR